MRRARLDQIPWDDFQKLPLPKKGPYFQQGDGRPYHVLIAQQFDRDHLDQLCQLATRIRRICFLCWRRLHSRSSNRPNRSSKESFRY